MSFDFGRAVFNQADLNRDGAVNQGEFSQWVGGGLGGGASISSTDLVDGGFTTVGSGGAVFGVGGDANAVFNQIDANRDGTIDRNEFNLWANNRSGVGGGGLTSSGICNPPTYQTDARGLYQDPNPRVETRVNPNPGPTYAQNIRIRFLQPPPLRPPQPIIINEVRPPPPPPPPPFRTIVPPTPAVQPPPLVLRENPPVRPPELTGKTSTVTLPPFPPVPRSVITERYPPLPPRPRDIILERWIQYGQQAKQQVIRRPAPCGPFPIPPRNLVIQYQPVQARVVRQFQSLGVTQADPQAYRQQYGGSLLDSATFVQQARAAGVVEDITPPAYRASFQSSSTSFVTDSELFGGGVVSGGGFNEASSSETFTTGEGFAGGLDVVGAAFRNADTNRDGALSAGEFGNFVQQGL